MDAAAEFWRFSLAVYDRPGVAAALIGLQDRHGLDVNLLLYCCWAGAGNCLLSMEHLAAVEAAAEPLQVNLVRPLRQIRRWLKSAPELDDLRRRIGDLEIDGEQLAQRAMAALAPPRRAATEVEARQAAANLATYVARRGMATGAAETDALAILLSACFPGAGA